MNLYCAFPVPEEKFLRTIELEEKFGGQTYAAKKAKEDKKKSKDSKAAIGFVYEDSTADPDPPPPPSPPPQEKEEDPDDDSDFDMDFDMTVDIMALNPDAQKEINKIGKGYHLGKEDFIRYLARDIEEQEELKAAKQQEEEKAAMSVRIWGMNCSQLYLYLLGKN